MAGYSGASLAKELGINEGFRVRTKNEPPHYLTIVAPLPDKVTISSSIRSDIDLWHLFTMNQINQNGMIWVSWPKKSSGVSTDVIEDTIRKIALPLGLVDIKVCAVDDVWSGLKLVIRSSNRR